MEFDGVEKSLACHDNAYPRYLAVIILLYRLFYYKTAFSHMIDAIFSPEALLSKQNRYYVVSAISLLCMYFLYYVEILYRLNLVAGT